jgi:hypothetical protein
MWSTTAGKYGVVTFTIVLAASLGAPAPAGVRLGLEIGANVSSLGYEHLDALPSVLHWDPAWRTSFTGGASLEFPLRRQVSMVTGLRYVQQGNRVKFSTTGPGPALTGEFRVAQHYVAMPLLLAFRAFPSQRYFIAAGPEGAVLLNGKIFTDYSSSGAASTSGNITHQLERANLSLDAEAGLEFPSGQHFGIVILRYTHGLVDVERKNDWAVAWKTRGVEGLVGMRW